MNVLVIHFGLINHGVDVEEAMNKNRTSLYWWWMNWELRPRKGRIMKVERERMKWIREKKGKFSIGVVKKIKDWSLPKHCPPPETYAINQNILHIGHMTQIVPKEPCLECHDNVYRRQSQYCNAILVFPLHLTITLSLSWCNFILVYTNTFDIVRKHPVFNRFKSVDNYFTNTHIISRWVLYQYSYLA